jgi:membrane fusion protein (multidrug efflux system)
VLLRAIFRNPDRRLLPGLYVREELQEGTNDQALLVPQQAVSHNPHGDPTVLLVGPDNKVKLQVIETGRTFEGDWIVTGGLKQGDVVVVDGLQKAKPGSEVKPEPFQAKADGGGSPSDAPGQQH